VQIDSLLRGQRLEREGRLDAAADAYREGLRQQPGDVAARIRLGLVLRQLGRDDEANEVFREVLELHPAEIDAD
jgi:Flp pilus assembly protein TadD